MVDAVTLQRDYYARTAAQYETMHDEHALAFAFMRAAIDLLAIRSVLDVGAGTGRAVVDLKRSHPGLRVVGLDPSPEMRAIGHANGLAPDELRDGDAQSLAYQAGEFDLVCEFGALHHMPRPSLAVMEMLRVSRRAVFISDSNNFGQGSSVARAIKHVLNALGLWRAADFVKTRGRGYIVTEGDGV